MSRRVTQVVLLCEDGQHEAFARRFLERLGVHRRAIRVEKAPKGRGSGEQWVREAYAKEVKAFRSASYIQGRALIVMVDEDTNSTCPRHTALEDQLAKHSAAERSPAEAILHAIPARSIETWIAYLGGREVDEATQYPRLERERDCRSQVNTLKAMCDEGRLRKPAPASLQRTCDEFRARWAGRVI